AAREILDHRSAGEIKDLVSLFKQRASANLATSDLSDAARAATYGAIETLLVDIDSDVPGLVADDTGALTLNDSPSATSYDVVDEIAGRALANGTRVLGVRKADLPTDGALAAILRFQV
ncbi:MAG: hypothetical protein ACR2PA_00380, partial [Hyphomicrobiaceae bacterium]